MTQSNIAIASNVFPCEGNPASDREFVREVKDFNLLKQLEDRTKNPWWSYLSQTQKQIIDKEKRCFYAQNDPCWGYVEGQGVICKCINTSCSRVDECRPVLKAGEALFWQQTPPDSELYGNPEAQKRYYLVDLISDHEKDQYHSLPSTSGVSHSAFYEEDQKKEPCPQIIGFERILFPDYCDEQLRPIYGYADEYTGHFIKRTINNYSTVSYFNTVPERPKQATTLVIQPAESVETIAEEPKAEPVEVEDYSALTERVVDQVESELELASITSQLLRQINPTGKMLFVLSNPAELAYLSSMLIKAGVEHSLPDDASRGVRLQLLCDLSENLNNEVVVLSKTVIDEGCTGATHDAWESFCDAKRILIINLTGREYAAIPSSSGKRWFCRNLYEATHICMLPGDLKLNENVQDGTYKATLIAEDSNRGYILHASNGYPIGAANQSLLVALDVLKREDEISSDPMRIEGIMIAVSGGKCRVYGIGRMIFYEY